MGALFEGEKGPWDPSSSFHAPCPTVECYQKSVRPNHDSSNEATTCALRHSFTSEHGGSTMLLPLLYIPFFTSLHWSRGTPLSLPAAFPRFAHHLPLYRPEAAPSLRRQAHKQDSLGLGDDIDVCGLIITALALLIVRTEHTMSWFKWAKFSHPLSWVTFRNSNDGSKI